MSFGRSGLFKMRFGEILKCIPAPQFGDASRRGGETNSEIVVNHETGGQNSECEIDISCSASSVDVLRGFSEAHGPRYFATKIAKAKTLSTRQGDNCGACIE